MSDSPSPNTQAILLLTAPLIVGRSSVASDLLPPGEYQRLARRLRDIGAQPSDLLSVGGSDVLHACAEVVEIDRARRLLERGFQLAQATERWHARSIWVLSRADAHYPRRLKDRLASAAPAILYGCGEIDALGTGGLAIVGSRHVDEALVDYTVAIGSLVARAGRGVVSGGAKGIDQAAMRGALEAGGQVRGVLADSLEKTAMTREHRGLIMEERLTLVSPFDPAAGFNVGHAMQRNKLIYALADAALVVSSDVDKGGTWAGATEQLDRYRFVPVYVRSSGEQSTGLQALLRRGATAWPEPDDADALEAVLAQAATDGVPTPQEGMLPLVDEPAQRKQTVAGDPGSEASMAKSDGADQVPAEVGSAQARNYLQDGEAFLEKGSQSVAAPADALIAFVREQLRQLLRAPMNAADVAAELGLHHSQAKSWLDQLVKEGRLEKRKKPAGYVVKTEQLFG